MPRVDVEAFLFLEAPAILEGKYVVEFVHTFTRFAPTAEMHAVPKLLQLSTSDGGQFSLLRQELSTIGINRILLAVLLLH